MKGATDGDARRCAQRVVACGILALAVAVVAGGEVPEQPDERIAGGQALYRIYCQNCHGASGRGDGPSAELLKVPPTDLTRLRKSNRGEFPGERVYRVIDGRDEVRGHGPVEMPLWGLAFQERDVDLNQEAEVRHRIESLVAYLESVQR